MTGAEAAARVSMEVLVEQHEIAPRRIPRIPVSIAVTGAVTVRVWQKEMRESCREILRHRA
jgi:hypothetical protein